MYVNTQHRQRGLSLVEVFVALLVLSVGLIALAKLQVDLVRGSSDARTRTVALALAEEKLEDLRTFAVPDDTGTWSTTVNPMAWSYITGPALTTPADTACTTACRGGRIAPQTSYSSALEVAGVRFKRTWEIDQRDFTNAGPPAITSRTKDVRVTIAWMNELGVEQQVSVLGNLVDIPPGNVAMASEPLTERPDRPRIVYDEGEAPQVIAVPIDLGDTNKRETTKPLPDVQAQGDYAHEVTFDVVNYHQEGDVNLVDRREEFVTVNCRCTLQASGRGRTPAKSVLTGSLLRDVPGLTRTDKPYTGTVRTSGQDAVSSQPALCNICCRDHHDGPDVNGDPNRYNPVDTTDHSHYLWDGSDYIAASVGDAYDEACRMKRVNGIFQVFEDWNLVAINAIPESALTGDTSDYTAYVASVVRNYVKDDPLPTMPEFYSPVTLTPGGAAQLQGRAIYIDYMTDVEKAAAEALITLDDDVSFLKSVPWYEVNLTKLARWKLQDTNTTTDYSTSPVTVNDCRFANLTNLSGKVACISSEPVQTEELQQNNYNRGRAKGGPVSGEKDAQVYLLNGNPGLIDTQALTQDANAAARVFDEIPVANVTGSAVEGTIEKTANNNPGGNPWSNVSCRYTVNGGASTSCGDIPLTNDKNDNNPRQFSFYAPIDSTVVVTISYTGGVVCPASQTVTAPAAGLVFSLKESGLCN